MSPLLIGPVAEVGGITGERTSYGVFQGSSQSTDTRLDARERTLQGLAFPQGCRVERVAPSVGRRREDEQFLERHFGRSSLGDHSIYVLRNQIDIRSVTMPLHYQTDMFDDDWDREWDRMSHAISEYQKEIREMRERIRWYVSRIEELETEVKQLKSTDARWVQES